MIFITGATGLLGSHLLWQLVSGGEKIRALVRNEKQIENTKLVFSFYCENPEEFLKKIEWVQGDLLNYHSFEQHLENIDEVYNTAAIVSYLPDKKQETINANILLTQNLVNACITHKTKKLCHVSSIAALGDSDDIIDEETSYDFPKNASGYSIGKYYSELEVWRGHAEGLDCVVVNPSVILGPGDWNKGSTALFKTVYKGLKFYTDGTTGYVDVRDVATVMIKLMKSNISGQKFLLNSENLDYKTFFTLIANNFGKKPPGIKADKIASDFLSFFENMKYQITGKEPIITKETSRIANSKNKYSGKKILEHLNFEYTPIMDSIEYTCKKLLEKTP